ncbi:MAG: hypothetical protein N2749_04760 [Clostridia bacterium]|nr:hypothetical protein [Clostridia bacterium]
MDIKELIFQTIQSAGIVASFIITIYTLRKNNRTIKASNSLLITQHHREIWTTIYQTDSLKRVFDKNADITKEPVTDEEFCFVNLIFLHMSSCLKLSNADACYKIQGMEKDIQDILSYPIPKYVWLNVYKFHDKVYADFVMRNIN